MQTAIQEAATANLTGYAFVDKPTRIFLDGSLSSVHIGTLSHISPGVSLYCVAVGRYSASERRALVFRTLGYLLKIGALKLANSVLRPFFILAADEKVEPTQKEKTGVTR